MTIRIDIERREPAPAKPGAPDYEVLRGRFHGELDPDAPCNAIITDLAAAPRNARGRVEYSATFAVAKPVDMRAASGVLLHSVPNRGMGWMGMGPGGAVLLDVIEADPEGHIRVVSGWQGDIPPRPGFHTADVPTAFGPGGESLTGPVLAHLADMAPGAKTVALAGGLAAPVPRPEPASLDTARAQLLRLEADDLPPTPIDPADWSFGDCAADPFPGKPDPGKVSLRHGFDPAYTYLLVYEAKDPKVLGIGFAATRDLIAFLHHGEADDAGAPNPLAGEVKWTIASGVSQAGNYLRSFLHLGFNADEAGRRVFDAMSIQIAARQLPLNVRFGAPGGAAGLYELGSEGVLWWGAYEDRARGRGPASLLDRCTAAGVCPKIMETFGSAEFWGLRMSPDLVGTDATGDIPLPDTVRRYYFPGVTHYGSFTGGFPVAGDRSPPGTPKTVLAGNPNPSTESLRAAAKMLVAWVKDGVEPPPSCYPTLTAGDLVAPTAEAMGWPPIPGAPAPDGKLNPFFDYDLGDGFDAQDESGVVTRQPPAIRRILPSRVPRVDADGNETCGIASVQHRVPTGTYTGWNERAEGYGKGRGAGMTGGFIPFARTRAQRLASGDPRPSLEERYGDHQGFVDRVRAVVAEQVACRWLLPEDAEKVIAQAEASAILKDDG